MATKSITIEEDAYDMLKSWKGERESFSDVVRKLTRRTKWSDFIGVLSPETGDRVEKAIRDGRKSSMKRQTRMLREFR